MKVSKEGSFASSYWSIPMCEYFYNHMSRPSLILTFLNDRYRLFIHADIDCYFLTHMLVAASFLTSAWYVTACIYVVHEFHSWICISFYCVFVCFSGSRNTSWESFFTPKGAWQMNVEHKRQICVIVLRKHIGVKNIRIGTNHGICGHQDASVSRATLYITCLHRLRMPVVGCLLLPCAALSPGT